MTKRKRSARPARPARFTGKMLRELRQQAGFSQSQLAKNLDCALRSLRRWEASKKVDRITELAVKFFLKSEDAA
jgi:transcriptional regulator with XRE-family HTH domain